jgi:PiT family inorganic phosphate transporter
MVVAWLITLPAAGLVAAAMYGVAAGIGGNAGIVAVAILAVLCAGVAWVISRRNPVHAGNVTDVPPVAIVAPEPAGKAPSAGPVAGAGVGA